MRSDPNSETVFQFEKDLADSYAAISAQDFVGQIRHALAGEYFGAATYCAFQRKAEDAEERRFWANARDVELHMIARLERLLAQRGLERPDRQLFWTLGERAAAVFSSRGYCQWVAPLIPEALAVFRRIDPANQPGDARAVVDQLIDHEIAFAAAWDTLDEGFEAATAPFAAHLRDACRITSP